MGIWPEREGGGEREKRESEKQTSDQQINFHWTLNISCRESCSRHTDEINKCPVTNIHLIVHAYKQGDTHTHTNEPDHTGNEQILLIKKQKSCFPSICNRQSEVNSVGSTKM